MSNELLQLASFKLEEGTPLKQIAKELDVKYRTLLANLKKTGLYVPTRKKAVEVTPEMVNQMKEMFNQGITFKDIAKSLGVTHSTIRVNLIKEGIHSPNHYGWTDEEKKYLQKLYDEGMSSREIAKLYSSSKNRILDALDETREPSSYRKYDLDQNAFENITTQEQAYWLGFLYADGSVGSTEHSITLGLTDKESVEQFREFLKTDRPLYVEERSKENPKWKDNYTLTVHSKKLKKDLIKLGCIPNKTEKLDRVPDLPEHLYRHFVRGIFDGDGSIWKSQERFHFSISGYLPFIDKVQDVIVKETGLNKTKLAKRKHNYGDIRYGGKKNLSVLKDYLYKDATVYMSRKKNTFNLILN